jgi:hypothetical protein
MEEKAASIPFWQDLFSVTDAVPPWGLFKVLAENPEIILRTPIPLTFLLAPGDKIEARLCTGLDDKLLIRRSSLKEPITWDTMVQNLKAVFDARGSDGQPFVCTIYGEDWKPRYVLAEIFNLFILYLRYSCGETLSSSYGQEEQREAAALFPPNIACVQAYIPLQSQTRYLAVTLRTPINTLMEVYRTSHVGQGCFPNSKDTLDSIITQHPHGENDLYQPLDSSNADAKSANRITASVLCCLRTQCHLKVLGLVCEFVRDVHGDLYLFAVSRCSKPQVKTFQAVVKPWRPSENQLVRILGAKYKTAPPSKPRKVPSISDANTTPQTASQTPKQSKKNSLTLVVDGEECKEGSQTSSVRQKGPRKSLAINVNVDEDEGQADEGQARCLDSVKSDGSEEVFPFGQDPSEGEALSKLHLNLILVSFAVPFIPQKSKSLISRSVPESLALTNKEALVLSREHKNFMIKVRLRKQSRYLLMLKKQRWTRLASNSQSKPPL